MAYSGKTIAFTDTQYSSVYIGQNTPNPAFTGTANVAVGNNVLANATGAASTTAIGDRALISITDGAANTAIGFEAGSNYTGNEQFNICINSSGVVGEFATLHIGDLGDINIITSYISGIYNASSSAGARAQTVIVDNDSQLCTLGTATNGQIVIGSTGALPVLATLTSGPGILITNAAGSITIGATGSVMSNFTSVTTSPYVATSTDYFLGVTTSAIPITVQLPNAPSTGREFVIKDSTGNSATNNITVTTVGGAVLIDGSTTYTMNSAYQAVTVLFDGTTYEVF
jgi:hypothetical protein